MLWERKAENVVSSQKIKDKTDNNNCNNNNDDNNNHNNTKIKTVMFQGFMSPFLSSIDLEDHRTPFHCIISKK